MELSPLWTDNAILQHGRPIVLRGWCNAPRVQVIATLGSARATCAAGWDGRFEARFPPLPPTKPTEPPLRLHVAASNGESCERTGLLLGEVWLLAGQSNAEFPLKTFDDADPLTQLPQFLEEGGAADDRMRVYAVPHDALATVTNDGRNTPPTARWRASTPENAPEFPAVGAWFALALRKRLPDLPVGIINCTWGGTNIRTWLSRETLAELPSGKEMLAQDDATIYDGASWSGYPIPYDYREQPADLLAEAIQSGRSDYHGRAPYSWNRPHGLYDTMVRSVIPYAIRGMLWYQGEEDADHPQDYLPYAERLEALVRSWRHAWAQGTPFPFLCVQIGTWKAPDNDGWCTVQDAQRRVCRDLPNAACVAIDDLSHDEAELIHPHEKRVIGCRLAQAALKLCYGCADAAGASPVLAGITEDRFPGTTRRCLRLHFRNAEGGLHSADGEPLRGFEIARKADGPYLPARACCDGACVLVAPADECDHAPIAAVRYNWRAFRPDGNLISGTGMPALTARELLPTALDG